MGPGLNITYRSSTSLTCFTYPLLLPALLTHFSTCQRICKQEPNRPTYRLTHVRLPADLPTYRLDARPLYARSTQAHLGHVLARHGARLGAGPLVIDPQDKLTLA